MARSRQEAAPFQCPICQVAFEAPVWIVLDAEERPDLRTALLQGDLHQTLCPHCGAAGTITAPLLYHDGRYQQSLLAVPLSVATPAAAQELAEQLVGFLHTALEAEGSSIPTYLSSVELVADLDGLQALLNGDDQDDPLVTAVEALLSTQSAQEFQSLLVLHRTALMQDAADTLLAALVEQARASDDHATARMIGDQRATLNYFRETLQTRRATLARIIDTLPTKDAEAASLAALRTIVQAIEPQDVYATRLQLDPAQQIQLDRLLDQAISAIEASEDETGLEFLLEIRRLREL
ncbi:MAG: hypothetical protein H0T53_13700 [Herpetosiphonaceae bacterium]|nr:hypothetical protein [Herpetosiphonaceae bacterium]